MKRHRCDQRPPLNRPGLLLYPGGQATSSIRGREVDGTGVGPW